MNDFSTQLGDRGLYIQTGPFCIHLQSSIGTVADGITRLYSEYPQFEEKDFADFHIHLDAVAGIRRMIRPQVQFSVDGYIPFKPLPLDQAFPMFEWGLNWCVAGWRLFSDELAMFCLRTRMLVPLPRPVNLKNNSINLIKNYAPEAIFGREVSDTNKGTVAHMKAPTESILRAAEGALSGWIIMPRYQEGAQPILESRPKAQTCMDLAQNSFNYSLLAEDGFLAISELIDKCDCYDFTYSQLDDAIKVFDELELPQ